MSIEAVVQQISAVLSRSHALFAGPESSGARMAAESGARLAEAGHRLCRDSTHTGRLADGHASFVDSASAAISALAGSDAQFSGYLHDAAHKHDRGSAASSAVIDAATADATALGLLTRTPAGQHALLIALRTQVAEQQRIIADTRADAADTAAAIRALTYPPATAGPTLGAAQ